MPATGQQPHVLIAPHRLADAEFHRRVEMISHDAPLLLRITPRVQTNRVDYRIFKRTVINQGTHIAGVRTRPWQVKEPPRTN